MIKLTFCLTRKDGMTREEFQDYWLNRHGPLVRKHAKALHIKRYLQFRSRDLPDTDPLRASRAGSLEEAPATYDGVAELWWENLDELRAGTQTEEGLAAGRALLEDEAKFIAFKSSPLWFGEEEVIVG